jgi:thiopurine S-methyltransferase
MEANFWHERWARHEIAFHEPEFNVLLTTHFHQLALPQGSRIFVPLCGKTLDIAWLLRSGYQVVGAELSELAVIELFEELAVEPTVTHAGRLKRYEAPGLNIHVGDIFDVTAAMLGNVDGIYDRAALVALPADMRKRYARHLLALTHAAPQLLICFEYDQQQMDGPPFSVTPAEVKALYDASYDLAIAATRPVAGGLKGKCKAEETVWLLKPRTTMD